MYVLKKIEDGSFVSVPGSHKSYTKTLQNAQTFNTKEQAESNACGNEYAVPVSDCFC